MILAFLFAIAGFIFFEFAGTHGWMGIPVGGAIGAIIALMRRVGALEERLENLRKALAEDWEERHREEEGVDAKTQINRCHDHCGFFCDRRLGGGCRHATGS